MLQESVLDLLYSKRKSIGEFNYDMLMAPNIYNLLSTGDITSLYNVTTSMRYAGNTPKKKKALDEIMERRGFKKFAFGTNRMVYRFLEDQSFVVKVPLHELALVDNLREMENQNVLKPFCSKCFQTDQAGEVGVFERVMPITNKLEYKSVADDVFDLIANKIIGKVVMEDIGTEYFMNIGIRKNFGVVLIDYPEMFMLDGNKLYCNAPVIPNTKFPVCGGAIDYDDGFNRLICKKCGKIYKARELETNIKDNLIIIKGGTAMNQPRVRLVRGNEVLVDTFNSVQGVDVITKPKERVNASFNRVQPRVRLVKRDPDTLEQEVVVDSNQEKAVTLVGSVIDEASRKAPTLIKPPTRVKKEDKAKPVNTNEGISFHEFMEEEEKLLKMDIPDDKVRGLVKVLLGSNGLAGHWSELTAVQKNVIINNAMFVVAPNVMADDPKPLPLSVDEVEPIIEDAEVEKPQVEEVKEETQVEEEEVKEEAQVEETKEEAKDTEKPNKVHGNRLKPSEQVINYAKKSAFIPGGGNINAY